MKTSKATKTIFWVTTIIIFLFEGVMPAFTSQTQAAKEGIRTLGYPAYFGNILVIFKILGTLILIIPQLPRRIKEWAYAGFAFDFIFASISCWIVYGFGFFAIFPLIFFALLIASYVCYERISKSQPDSNSGFKTNGYVTTNIA